MVRLLLLALAVIVLWLSIEDRWGSNFSLPTRYEADAHYVLGMMRLSQKGDLGLFNHITTDSLGAPFTGQLNDFPQTERAILWLGGQIARMVGLIPAANVMLILSCLIAALSFYCAARLWKISQLTSWLFAIAYAFLPHTLRSIEHLGAIFSGVLPLQLYVLWYIATAQKLYFKSQRFRLAISIGLLSGALNIYWIFLFLQLYSLALLWRIIRRRQYLLRALIPITATSLVATAFLASFIIYKVSYGENPSAVVRAYADVEKKSLKPIELLLPGRGDFIPVYSNYLSRYYGNRIFTGEGVWGAYIGISSIIGLLFLFLKETQNLINSRIIIYFR